ncbi:hypothetical protein AB0M20_02685 [Actinoplanes sp. NPDC051633]|uniref:hypothetical protein n=1 Tax=Actinoplanes sp. NPDC051633 TaxID=3155670 RepID=UPI0034395E08
MPYPQQQQQPPTTAYSTAPPWAPPPPNEPPATLDGPYTQHGQLLVPFPEEMQAASRPTPPAWWPVVLWTFFFGILALVTVVKRADMARRGRNSVGPYWIAWGVTMAIGSMLAAVFVAAGIPALQAANENSITRQVQENIVTDGKLAGAAQVKATTANCDPVGERDASGIRRYDCVLALDDGRTGTLAVTADSDGRWTAVPAKK